MEEVWKEARGACRKASAQFIECMYAANMPAVFLSVLIDDCIKKGVDYNNAGPRYNTNYIQCVGIGTITDSLSVIKKHIFEDKTLSMSELLGVLSSNFEGKEDLRQMFKKKKRPDTGTRRRKK